MFNSGMQVSTKSHRVSTIGTMESGRATPRCTGECRCLKNKVKCSVHCHATEFDCGNLRNLGTRTEIALVDRGRGGAQQPTQRVGDATSEEPEPSDIESPAASPAKAGAPAPAPARAPFRPRKRQCPTIAKTSGNQVAATLVGGEETAGRVPRPRKRVKGN